MATPGETSRLRTLADAVSEPALSATLGSGLGPDKNGPLSRGILGGFDVNKVSEEEEAEDSVVVVTKRTEISVAESRMTVALDGMGTGLEATKNFGHGVALGLGSLDGKIGAMSGSLSDLAKNGTIEDLNADSGGNVMVKMDGEKGGGDDAESIEGHGYSVGDLVWGKIKSHPWWPGQIYDPKHASDYALKFNQMGRLLVAYFGDGSFAWCQPSQLIPFAEHFEDMSKQSNSKSFLTAVQDAVDEIGRLVELEMTCKCVPEENRKGLNTPVAANAGIKAGVVVPEGGIGKLLSFRYDSAELLATVQSIAESVSFASVLELAILKSWLSAFCRARGGYGLPFYYEGLQIEGLEANNRIGVKDKNDFSVPIEVPIQRPHEGDRSLALAGPGNGPAPSDDQNHHGRKQKSVAEIMAEGTDKKFKSRKRSIAIRGTNASSSAKQKRKDDEDGNLNGNIEASETVRKRSRKKISNAENGHIQPQAEIHKNSLSSKLEDEIAVADDDDGEGTKGTEEISSPRERKKSKYLSPPYTNSRFRSGNPILKKELKKESEKISKIARMGERMTKAAGILLESPPVVKCNAQTVEEQLPPNGKQDQQTIIDSVVVSAPVKEVLAGVKSGAVNPFHSLEELPDFIRGFIFAFRMSVCSNQTNYTPKRLPGRKRKSLSSEQGDPGNVDANLAEAKFPQSIGKRSAGDKSDKPKQKKNARGSGVIPNDKEVDGKSSPESLLVTFAPGFSLPSKDDIIRTFSKFGVLNEKETVVLPESSSIRIVYSSPPGAEAALRASLRQSPFGSPNVNYKLRYSSAAPVAVESSHNTPSPPIQTADNPVALWPATGTKSKLVSIRRKLEIMTSMLEKCDGKISTEEVSKLDSEIKPLFEKVRKIAEDVSH